MTLAGKADVNLGLSIGDEGIKGFYLAIGEHYRVPEKEIVVVRQKQIPNEEIPVVFFLARKAGTSPETIVKLRLEGKSWMDISLHFGLSASIFYVPLKDVSGPPYGKAYGHFKNRQRQEWHEIHLTDIDVINFVNLKFISEHYGYPPDEVVKLRQKGESFMNINTLVKKNKDQAAGGTKNIAEQNDTPKKNPASNQTLNNPGKGKKK